MSNTRWVHVNSDNTEINYDSEPADVPTLRITVISRSRKFIEEECETWLIRVTPTAMQQLVMPRGLGWRLEDVHDCSARFVRRRPANAEAKA